MNGVPCRPVPRTVWRAALLQLYANATQVLPTERNITSSLQHPPCHLPGHTVASHRALINPCPGLGRMELYTHQPSSFMRPVEFVFLVAMEKVVLVRSFLDRALNRQRHRRDSNTVLAENRIETRLVEVERIAVVQPVKRPG